MSLRQSFVLLAAIAAAGVSVVPGHASAPAAPPASAGASTAAKTPNVTPAQIIAAAPALQWISIAPEDLLVMQLAPPEAKPTHAAEPGMPVTAKAAAPEALAANAKPVAITVTGQVPAPGPSVPLRRVVIQLIAPPYSQGWVANIRALAAEHWWDGLAIVRAQDNYVVQWGDPNGEDPTLARALPKVLQKMPQGDYLAGKPGDCGRYAGAFCPPPSLAYFTSTDIRDSYAQSAGFVAGWPVAIEGARSWPVHCYGTVGVGRNVAPDTGSGAELYAVIGQAPRQLDRNIAVVGRVIEGVEYLSSLARGTAELGFYATPEERTGIVSIRSGSEVTDLPRYEYLSTNGDSFARYVHARANRQDDFYIQPAGAVDVCNVPVPIRKVPVPAVNKKKQGSR
jgi:peptidylprolyl isomerase